MQQQTTHTKNVYNPELYTFDSTGHPQWMIFPKIAIMTVTFNRLDYTKKLLDSLYNKTHLPFTLYILDQASTDGTSEYLEQLRQTKENVKITSFRKNIGKGRAYLSAQRSIKDDLLVYMDNDIELLSNYWLLHLMKAYYAYFLHSGGTDIALGIRMINLEEYGFLPRKKIRGYTIPTEKNALPRTSYSLTHQNSDEKAHLLDESISLGHTDFLCGGIWSISMNNFRRIPWKDYYPRGIGAVDHFCSQECQRLNIDLAYIENGPIARHNDWPYTDEKIQFYNTLKQERAVTDIHYLRWKIKEIWSKLFLHAAKTRRHEESP